MPRNTAKDRVLSHTEVRSETEANRTAEPAEDLGAILDALPTLVSYWDSGMRNRLANGAFVEFFGLTPEEIRGRHVSDGPRGGALRPEPPIHRAGARGRAAAV